MTYCRGYGDIKLHGSGLFDEVLNIWSGWIDNVARITGRLAIMTARRDEDGDAISFACTGTAITDRHRNEPELHRMGYGVR